MPSLKILEHLGELTGGGGGIEREDSVDNVICTRLIGSIEIPWLGRGSERAHDDSRWIGAQVEILAGQGGGARRTAFAPTRMRAQRTQTLKARSDGRRLRLALMRAS